MLAGFGTTGWMRIRTMGIFLLGAALLVSACGSGSGSAEAGSTVDSTGASAAAPSRGRLLTEWPEFGLDPQRANATDRPTGITAANVDRLRSKRIALPGTVDSSPIYLHAVRVRGGRHDAIVLTTTYGRTIAIDADSASALWTFTPPGYRRLLGSPQITTASPIADPGGEFVYAASPDGLIHKLSLLDGHEASGGRWPVRITRDPTREKIAAALNVDGPDVARDDRRLHRRRPDLPGPRGRDLPRLRSHRRRLQHALRRAPRDHRPPQLPAERLGDPLARRRRGRAGRQAGARLDRQRDLGRPPLLRRQRPRAGLPGLRLRQSFTPRNQAQLNAGDTDLGSSAPALLGHGRLMIAGKDGLIRVLRLSRLNGRRPGSTRRLGGEVQTLPTPGGDALFTQPAVWRHGGSTTVFVADFSATASYALRNGRLRKRWENDTPGTSPILADGLLYVYEPSEGGIEVYSPSSPSRSPTCPAPPATGTARSSSTAMSSSRWATETITAAAAPSSSSRRRADKLRPR